MRVLLVDVDSKIPNLALMKLSAFYKSIGWQVGFDINNPEFVYISCIFSKNAAQAKGITSFYPTAKIDIGGSGVDTEKKLSDSIELIKPDYDLYPSTYSQGYTTRGCIRNCEFCIVPKKEGKIRISQHPREFHDDRFDTCMIMDNNLFGAPLEWQHEVFTWFVDNNIKMLSPQGWDARLLTEEKWKLLSSVKHAGQIHFAWDNIKDEKYIERAIEIIKSDGISARDLRSTITFYVLCGFNTTIEEDIYRCEKLKELGTNAFVMPYHKKNKRLNDLARWANRKWLYWAIPFKEYKKKN